MNVSSINNSAWWYQLNALKKASANTDSTTDTTTTTTASTSQSITMNSDGDTFELSGNAPPPPPPPGPPPANGAQSDSATDSSTNSSSDLIREFLDKVADGTVTETDLDSIQKYLLQLQANSTDSTNNAGNSNGAVHHRGDALKAFLDKVADGSVTEEDLSSMQSFLQQMQQNMVGGTSAASNSNSTAGQDQLETFLEKVAAGSVTKDDLASMQTFLQQLQQGKAS